MTATGSSENNETAIVDSSVGKFRHNPDFVEGSLRLFLGPPSDGFGAKVK